MNGEAIKSFLVGLGFGVDDSSLAAFNKALGKASLKVLALYTSVKLMAAAVVYSISKISEGFEQMGYEYRIIAPAINKALVLRRELLKAYAAAGINIREVVMNSVKLNMSLTKTKYALEAIYKSVGSKFFTLLTKQSDLFREKLYKNMPKIQHALENLVKFIFKAFEATVTLGTRLWSILTRVYDFFVKFDKATDGWSTIILGVVAAWKLLNLSFLATPIGMILTGLLALLALFDDFKTWEEGGQSLFDWTSFLPVIDAVTTAMKSLWEVTKAIGTAIAAVISAIYLGFSEGSQSMIALEAFKMAAMAIVDVFSNLWDHMKNVFSAMGKIGSWAAGLFKDAPQVVQNVQNTPGVQPSPIPLGSTTQNSQVNQNVKQQTNITVMGGADAQATAGAVAGQQGRVNGDMVRNMKGSVR